MTHFRKVIYRILSDLVFSTGILAIQEKIGFIGFYRILSELNFSQIDQYLPGKAPDLFTSGQKISVQILTGNGRCVGANLDIFSNRTNEIKA